MCPFWLTVEDAAGGTRVSVSDTGLGFVQPKKARRKGAGVGLENVRRRLRLCYGSEADLEITSSDTGTTVAFLIPNNPRIGLDGRLVTKSQVHS
jgi:LytS/YehU family sensor histidine kinase